MADQNKIEERNIVIQGVTEKTITVVVDGKTQEIEKKLDVLQALMEQLSAKSFQTAGNIYNIGNINNATFGLTMARAGEDKSLPAELKQNLLGEGDKWIRSLERALIKEEISVSDEPLEIFQKYDWLIQAFLQKMCTPAGQEKTLRRLSFMAETYQASLRYLCYIQMTQVLQMENKPKQGIISDFIQMEGNRYLDFDYAGLLLTTTDLLGQNTFMKEINIFAEKLNNNESDLFGSVLYLEDQRRKLMANKIAEDEKLPGLLDEYLTALVCWLKELSFLANYRLVSIKEINLNYRLGTTENYLHRYGELHSMYNDGGVSDKSKSIQIKGSFTFSKSVLLFKGNVLDASLKNLKDKTTYLSLSPLLIDKSVYADENTKQTPEIFYYTGYEKAGRQYNYAQLNKELTFTGKEDNVKYPPLTVKETNTNLSGLDELFAQLNEVFKPFKNKQA